MLEAKPQRTDFTQQEQISPCGSLLASSQLRWEGIRLEHYRHPPCKIPENYLKQHIIIITTEVLASIEYEQAMEGRFRREQLREGNIIIIPADLCHWACWNTEHYNIILSIDPGVFKRQVSELSINSDRVELVPHFARPDPLIYGIGLALKQELKSDELWGSSYIDSLNHTLLAHLLQHYSTRSHTIREYSGGLPKYKLRQVIEYIHEHLDHNLTLSELAAVVRMSPSYFSSLFKQSTGLAPYQYVIQCRVRHAKQLLLQNELTIAEIAHRLGFTNQSHLNRHFKRLVGVTPKKFLDSQ